MLTSRKVAPAFSTRPGILPLPKLERTERVAGRFLDKRESRAGEPRNDHPVFTGGGLTMTSTRSRKGLILGLALVMVVSAASLAGAGSYRLVTRVDIPGAPLASFDISWVDAATHTY